MPVALLIMIFRKMVKNRWLQLSLLLGLTLAVALISSMPVYSDAILHRMLLKDLENIQLDKNVYPGMITSRVVVNKDVSQTSSEKIFKQAEAFFLDHSKQFTLPIASYVRSKTTYYYPLTPVDSSKIDKTQNRGVSIVAMNDLEKHIRLIDGQLPAKELVNGAYEVIVRDAALSKQKMVLGNEFTIINEDKINKTSSTIRVKLVGVFEPNADNDLYWEGVTDSGSSSIYMNEGLFEKHLIGMQKWPVFMVNWNTALDYTQIKLRNINTFKSTYAALNEYFSQYMDYKFSSPMIETLNSYEKKMQKLRILLWSLYAPMLVLLSFYLFMVEHLMIQRQKNDISIFRSRGASRWQIIWSYAIESLLLGALALAMGPPLGVLMTKLLGASNGFLEFVQRAALEAHLSTQSYKYALLTIAGSIVMTLIPAFLATRSTIVGHKQSLARGQKQSFAHKYYIDIALIAVSFYGYYSFKQRTSSLRTLGLDSLDFSIDPLLFVIPAFFIIGMGLFLLRIYPWVIQLIFWLGKKWWSPSAYASLVQVSRSSVNYQFVMIFLVITIATGLFSASAARTINRNIEEQTQYKIGADMVLTTQWQDDAPPASFGPPGGAPAPAPITRKKIQYKEPPFLVFSQLNGVEHAARVFKKEHTFISVGNSTAEVATLMGIDTDDFGRTAWLRDGLMGYNFYEYLNLIAGDPSSVLISRSVADKLKVKAGDRISVNWEDTPYSTFNVFAIIDYWPSWMPNPDASTGQDNKVIKGSMPMLVVGSLSYIQANMALEPYQVWLKLLPGATSKQVYDAMAEKKLNVTSLTDEKQAFIESKKDPFRLAINGVMTLGFVVSIMICFFGFLLYWILTLSGRVLQFGIFRAMGMSLRQVIRMLFIEQLLTSGAAIVNGAVTGLVTSHIFVSFFQISFNPATQALPFHVITDKQDQLNLFYVVFFMIALALVILGFMLSRIRIHQAVKLGED